MHMYVLETRGWAGGGGDEEAEIWELGVSRMDGIGDYQLRWSHLDIKLER